MSAKYVWDRSLMSPVNESLQKTKVQNLKKCKNNKFQN